MVIVVEERLKEIGGLSSYELLIWTLITLTEYKPRREEGG